MILRSNAPLRSPFALVVPAAESRLPDHAILLRRHRRARDGDAAGRKRGRWLTSGASAILPKPVDAAAADYAQALRANG